MGTEDSSPEDNSPLPGEILVIKSQNKDITSADSSTPDIVTNSPTLPTWNEIIEDDPKVYQVKFDKVAD